MSRATARSVIFGACLSALSTCASASIIVDLTSISLDNNGLCPGGTDGYRWSFSATISAGETGGRFTIYDFPGTICTVEPQSGSASSQLLGVIPLATDDPTLRNVTVNNLTTNSPTLDKTFLTDIILMTSTPLSLVYAWQDLSAAGVVQSGMGTVGSTVSIPEPAILALLGLALTGIGFARRRNHEPQRIQ